VVNAAFNSFGQFISRVGMIWQLKMHDLSADLREDKHFFMDHPGAVPITTAQVRYVTNFPNPRRGGVEFLIQKLD